MSDLMKGIEQVFTTQADKSRMAYSRQERYVK